MASQVPLAQTPRSDVRLELDADLPPHPDSSGHVAYFDASTAAAAAAAIAAAERLNKRNAQANAAIDVASEPVTSTYPANQPQFRTIAPSPSPQSSTATTPQERPGLSTTELVGSPARLLAQATAGAHGPPGASLRMPLLQTENILPPSPITTTTTPLSPATVPWNGRANERNPPTNRSTNLSLDNRVPASSLQPVSRTPSFKAGVFSTVRRSASAASSTVPSPIITAMGDVTPLPSPLLSSDSPGPWKRLGRPPSRDVSTSSVGLGLGHSPSLPPTDGDSVLVTSAAESVAAAVKKQSKRKSYAALAAGMQQPQVDRFAGAKHERNRSISEYTPDPMGVPRRTVAVSGSHVKMDMSQPGGGSSSTSCETFENTPLRREPNLSEARGLTPVEKPPTPPPSESSLGAADSAAGTATLGGHQSETAEYFEAYGRHDRKKRRWRAIKVLGQGTFSRVLLATSQMAPSPTGSPTQEEAGGSADEQQPPPQPPPQPQYARRTLVAVKVCEHGPRGGASEDRVEMSLKRELEIMQSIRHASLVHLKAWAIEPSRAILVLNYCPGGDLFDVASAHRDVLLRAPALLRRMFAELVGAVGYLHERRIVHRDIKLENVLVNLPPAELASPSTDWATYPYAVITLTDLGLSRRIADDERLETRCGSDDYAAPEVIMGQPYDGRATDAWSLGVLLYALLEGRLPFDPLPTADPAMQVRMRSRTSHRIARVEWRWVALGVDDHGAEGGGEHEPEGEHEADVAKFARRGVERARDVVEGLLKRARSRWGLDAVRDCAWVRAAVQVDGGVRFREEEEGEEVY
ncbi:hypothetical protein P8C59_004013 [Phyllachora maydis]|uniref:Protein kinase domain-containing protein n=1 Tax=Phyllachora maydis TaxID=1825666 RepID=A0AAD9I2I6_9PEZI|nr:hypothetical protein P8C59_004013 [Phyllachora maydis]